MVLSQPLSQHEMLSWKTPALHPQPFLGLLRLSFAVHSLFPAPTSSSPLQLPFLFSLTPNIYLRSIPFLHTVHIHFPQLFSLTFKLSLWCKANSWGALQSPRKVPLFSPGDLHLARNPVPAHLGFYAVMLSLTAANPNRNFLPAVPCSCTGACCCAAAVGNLELFHFHFFTKFTSQFTMTLNRKVK